MLSDNKRGRDSNVLQENHNRSGRRRRRRKRLVSAFPALRKEIGSISISLMIFALFLASNTIPFRGSTNKRHVAAFVHAPAKYNRIDGDRNRFAFVDFNSRPRSREWQRKNTNPSSTKTFLAPEISPTGITGLTNYAPAATTLFNNMKLPAAVVTAGMISLGFATTFPELPKKSATTGKPYPANLRARCESLKRLHIVVSLISVTSELVVVLWAAVEVNQLTEKQYELATSVWDLIQRDCDLAWSAVNSHFVLGIMGFVTMLALRAYVMLLAVEASTALMTAASTGTGAALCLLISIVNRGVESGGGDGYRYGNTIIDLLTHYVVLLSQQATNEASPGPLQLLAIILELVSLTYMANVLLFQNGKMKYNDAEDGMFGAEECPVIDIVEVSPSSPSINNDATNVGNNGSSKVRVVVNNSRGTNGSSGDPFYASTTDRKETQRAKVARCLEIEENEGQVEDDEEIDGEGDSTVSPMY